RGYRMQAKTRRPQIVCFGMITPAAILIVERMPAHNTGALIEEMREYIFDDAAIVACLLRQWDVRSGLIGTTLGDDTRGRAIARQLKSLGVAGKVRFSKKIATPFEVDVSDRTGARTYFWQREPRVLNTLDTADLSFLRGAQMLYVDWYDGDHIVRAMDAARRWNVPVFLNLEHGHCDPRLLARYVRRATICQASTDPAQKRSGNARAVARKLLDAGAQIALVTLAGEGCLVARRDEILRVRAPRVQVVDGCGAGATFSTGFIYGHLRGWTLEESARFATAAASLKVACVGLELATVAQVKRLAVKIDVERK
ncbi:MAG: carbohydrate kinase family protein, partial [Anaerolineales bacterium]|nr:carbohydrate kinase family protein [Anaerolineales bacterium]